MESIHEFISNRKLDLIQIYLNERISRGDGLLLITLNRNDKIDCIFLEDIQLPPELYNELASKRRDHETRNEVIFFYLCSPDSAQLLAVNLQINENC